ncbi:olfactory receptor 6Y1-like [Hyperolius riggenbachi]|uniref:olfactory receptor 6Y1-like n=1 Tax=Hyperolius riggenbachi TaxID=752182 RepID=UPI0035A2CC27
MNRSSVTEFLLLGGLETSSMLWIFFSIFMVAYMLGLAGNLTIIVVIRADARLHKPMYFLLENLSFLDISLTTIIVPTMLDILLSKEKVISFHGCINQMFFSEVIIVTECFILVVMAYDRYLAICLPFRYLVVMTKPTLILMVASCWFMGLMYSITYNILLLKSVFCGPNIIRSFFCDGSLLVKLSCSDASELEQFQQLAGLFVGPLPILMVLSSYVAIISAIMRIHSTEGRKRTFSTCVSHLVVVTFYYGTGIFTYLIKPMIENSHGSINYILSAIYTLGAPMLNPFIYSLRNQEIHRGFTKTFNQNIVHLKWT